MRYDTGRVNALVLAGGINRIELFPGYTPGYKAVLPFRGKPLLQYTLDALRGSTRVERICIVGPVEDIRPEVGAPGSYELLPGTGTLTQNLTRGLSHFRDAQVVLVTTADLPLVTPGPISDFLNSCGAIEVGPGAHVFWSMVPEENFAGHYRKVRKGFNRFRDRSVCHGNLLLITPALLNDSRFLFRMERIYDARKSSIRAALAVGPRVGLSYLLGVHLFRLLSLDGFARIASAGFGVGLIPVVIHDPDIAVDIDEARDYAFIEEELDRRNLAGIL